MICWIANTAMHRAFEFYIEIIFLFESNHSYLHQIEF